MRGDVWFPGDGGSRFHASASDSVPHEHEQPAPLSWLKPRLVRGALGLWTWIAGGRPLALNSGPASSRALGRAGSPGRGRGASMKCGMLEY